MPPERSPRSSNAGVTKVPAGPSNTGASGNTIVYALQRLTRRQERELADRLAGTINVQHAPVREDHTRPQTLEEATYRNVALFLPIEHWPNQRNVESAAHRMRAALTSNQAFRFQNLGDPLRQHWYADEELGRTVQQMYKGWSDQFDEKLRQTHQNIRAVANELGMIDEDSQNKVWKRMENVFGDAAKIKRLEKELASTKELVESYHTQYNFLDPKIESNARKIERLQTDVKAKDTLISKADAESDKYRVDYYLRMLLQHWGITNGDHLDPSRWQKYDNANRFAAEFQEYLDDVLNGIPTSSGNLLVQVRPPIGVKQLMRVASVHRIVHGVDLLVDCRVVALRLVSARHDEANTTEVSLLPKDLEGRSEGETFSQVYVPPPPPPTLSAVTTGMAQLTTSSQRAQLTEEQREERVGAIKMEAQFLVGPGVTNEERTWQALFDGTVLQLYNLNAIACEHILVALTGRKSLTSRQLEERNILQSHVDFINKWASIMEMVHLYAKKAQLRPGSWKLWGGHWFRIRNRMTEQCFGAHDTLAPGQSPWSRRTKRGLFHDYVGLFGQTCKLFNQPALQTEESFKKELHRLNMERWNLYRYAIQTWTHGDARGGINDNGQYRGNPPKPTHPKKVNLWVEWNWIYETDQWKYAPRLDPKQPPGAPALWDPLIGTEPFKDFSPYGPVRLAIRFEEHNNPHASTWGIVNKKKHPP
ncbi:uncharacterized protein QC761_123155 [Podospora bellae-mahoneyi]|uniref:Uncharacterized protein n=1 Tax=Podospora bellae-mahoneyi TaxID=2093777 RepID=A0ABR0FTA3_9PEZI|nr:hypothetical protein QC761_123155 [Podospora bellae-mahoneyi]